MSEFWHTVMSCTVIRAENMVEDGGYSSVAEAWDSAADSVADSLRTQTLADWVEENYLVSLSFVDTRTRADVAKAIGFPNYKQYRESLPVTRAKRKPNTKRAKAKVLREKAKKSKMSCLADIEAKLKRDLAKL